MSELQDHINADQKEFNREMKEHARVSNEEMGVVKTDIQWLKNEFSVFRAIVERLDNRIWWILGTVIFALIMQIAFNIYKLIN